jgi:hypothetical protein
MRSRPHSIGPGHPPQTRTTLPAFRRCEGPLLRIPKLFARLRECVRADVQASSPREVSRVAGVSQGALQRFLAGGRSMPATSEKMFNYVVRTAIATTPDAAFHLALIQDMLAAIDAALRPMAVVEAIRSLRWIYRQHGRTSPPWLAVLGGVVDSLSDPPALEDEEIGSMLDGALGGRARNILLLAAADSASDTRVLADTASVLREADSGDA